MSTCIHIGFNCNVSWCKETFFCRCVTQAQCRDSPCISHRTVAVSYLWSPKQRNISEPQIPFPQDYISKRSHVFPYPWDNAGWCAERQHKSEWFCHNKIFSWVFQVGGSRLGCFNLLFPDLSQPNPLFSCVGTWRDGPMGPGPPRPCLRPMLIYVKSKYSDGFCHPQPPPTGTAGQAFRDVRCLRRIAKSHVILISVSSDWTLDMDSEAFKWIMASFMQPGNAKRNRNA